MDEKSKVRYLLIDPSKDNIDKDLKKILKKATTLGKYTLYENQRVTSNGANFYHCFINLNTESNIYDIRKVFLRKNNDEYDIVLHQEKTEELDLFTFYLENRDLDALGY